MLRFHGILLRIILSDFFYVSRLEGRRLFFSRFSNSGDVASIILNVARGWVSLCLLFLGSAGLRLKIPSKKYFDWMGPYIHLRFHGGYFTELHCYQYLESIVMILHFT